VTTLLALLILASVLLYLMTPDERVQFGRAVLATAGRAIRAATRGLPSGEPFNDFLRARTRWTVVTPLLIALNMVIFTLMLFDAGAVSDPQTLVNWGGNIALRTTNGDWWRLIAATFVHTGMLHLLATVAGLVPLGLILERAVGPVAFATVYVAAGILGSVVSLWTTSAIRVSVGASAAIFGIYGLLLAALLWCLIDRPAVSIPVITVRRISVAAGTFILYNLMTDDLGTTSELTGLATGFASGLVAARGVARTKPAVHHSAWLMAATVLIAVVCAVPVRGVADVAPEMARVVAVEDRTIGAYDAAVVSFRKHRITADALAEMIDGTILPELQVTRARLKALRGVPPEHVPLVAAAEEYVQLREQSWRRRAEGLLQSNTRMLREAEETERAALEALRRLRPAG
jgi:membrane associated rhomboid family serine protease